MLIERDSTFANTFAFTRHHFRTSALSHFRILIRGLDWLDTQLSLLCSLYKVILCKLFTNLLEYTLIQFILFDETNRICVCKSIKTTKLVQANTIACSTSAMLEQHGSSRSTRSSRLARLARQSRTCRVESSRVEPSGIWALHYFLLSFSRSCVDIWSLDNSAISCKHFSTARLTHRPINR